jgi:catechol 2,3-dioxygenase-like lactoylglutathione lyase family enzyme
MPLELYMVGLIVRDMPAALAFYRRLGLAIPDGAETRSHVQVKMAGGLTLFFDTHPERWDPGFDPRAAAPPAAAPSRYGHLLEFYLQDQAALEAKYAELVEAGYAGTRAPYPNGFGMIFALVQDPDGNTLLLSADPASAGSS